MKRQAGKRQSPNRSRQAFGRARKVLVGGVNSPVRSFLAVGGDPVFIASARGSCITDLDGRTYVDYVGGYGPAILGHAYPAAVKAVQQAARRGFCYGAPTLAETELAEMIVAAYPSIRKLRFVSSGTEAAMSAIRLARGFTGRCKIIKCRGGYHGHADCLLASAGSGAATLGLPASPGVTPGATRDTMLVDYNDLAGAAKAFKAARGDLAAVIVEPVAGNMGVVPPEAGYLQGLRELCTRHGALLIFDEVMTGFRVAYGGAQRFYGVRPDLTTLGKIIGGGLPVGAFGGPVEIMKNLAPEGPVYQAGTLSGNPLAMAAGLAALRALRGRGVYARLEKMSAYLEAGLKEAAAAAGLAGKLTFNRVASMLTCFFAPPPVRDYRSATAANARAYAVFFHAMLEEGIFLAPSQYEAMFVSAAHRQRDIDRTIDAAGRAFALAARHM
jgi:glutamate-1-semialdehyde 2,1-aminomutase